MEHMQNCKKWFELKTRLGKNYAIDKFNSEGRPNICGTQAATKPELALHLTVDMRWRAVMLETTFCLSWK
jgi:hypothetical protein